MIGTWQQMHVICYLDAKKEKENKVQGIGDAFGCVEDYQSIPSIDVTNSLYCKTWCNLTFRLKYRELLIRVIGIPKNVLLCIFIMYFH